MGPEVTRIHVCGLRAWSSRDRERSAVEAARRARACMACSACRYRNCMRSFPRQGECALCRPREIRDPLPFYYLSRSTLLQSRHPTRWRATPPGPSQEAAASMAGGASPQHLRPVRRGRLISAACGGKATCTYLLTVDLSFRVLVPLLGSFCLVRHLLFFNSKKLNETKMSTGKLGMDSRTKIREFIFTPPPAMQKIVRSK